MSRSSDPVLLALLVASLACNVYQYRSHVRPRSAPPRPSLKIGEKLPPLTARDLRGQEVTLRFEAKPTIIYVFSPKCRWCDRNLENARELSQQTIDRYDFIAVSLEDSGLPDYLRDHQLNWRVLAHVPSSVLESYRLAVTPQQSWSASVGSFFRRGQGLTRQTRPKKFNNNFA